MTSGAVSALQDESSMPSLVLAGLQSIYKLTARKHKQLRQECEEIIQAIQRDDEEQQRSLQQRPASSPSSASSATSPPPMLADTDADKYFLPFKLACESDNSRMQAVALNQIEKLIAYGYLDGASVADPNVYPVRKSDTDSKEAKATPAAAEGSGKGATAAAAAAAATASDAKSNKDKDKAGGSGSGGGGPDSSRRLISVIVDTVYECSLNKDRDVQLQAVKCILTALTSTTCSVHGATLVSASYACWNIYLQASDDTIRNTAKAALTQTFSLVFQRMESFGSQLKQMQQSAALQPPPPTTNNNTAPDTKAEPQSGSATLTKAEESEKEVEERKDEEQDSRAQQDTEASSSDGSTKQQQQPKEEEEKVTNEDSSGTEPAAAVLPSASADPPSSPSTSPPPLPAASVSASASPAPAAVGPASPSSTTAASSSPSDGSGVSRPPPGKRGYCVVCQKPANYYCLQTRDSVCSVDCKLVNLQRRDKKSTIASDVHAKIQKKFVILQTDAFMLLRALIRLSKKPLPSPAEPSAVDSKLLSLELLLAILKQPGTTFKSSEQFVSLVKTEVTDVILKNSDASIEALFSLSSSLFVALVHHFRQHLHRIIGPVLDSIYLPYISSSNASYEVKYASLLVLKQICSDASIILELFLNYDCDISSYNTFQKIATTLEKTVQGSYFAQLELSQLQENRLKMLGLEALVDTIKSLVEWTKRGEAWENRERAAAAKKKEERDKEGEEAQSSGSSSPSSAATASRFAANAPRASPSPSHSSASAGSSTASTSTSSASSSTGAAAASAVEDGDEPRSAPHSEDTYVAASSTSSTFSSQFHQLRQQKQKLDTGILRFNMKPKKGLQYLVEHGLLDNTAESVAAFFHANAALDKTVVGDYMGEDVEFNKKVLHAFAQQMDFRGLSFDDAIRTFVSGFRLPGEAQKIDRMMLEFASQYHINNPGRFSSADTAYVLAYSVIMLNSDQHNPQVKNRMTKEEFFRNNRGIDNGKDIDAEFLSYIFDRIATNEIKMKDDPYKTAVKTAVGGEMSGQTRVVAFMKESQQMVKKTQDLIKNIGKARDKGRGLEDHSDETDSGGSGARGGGGAAGGARAGGVKGDKPFYLSQDSDWQACGAMFEILWYPSLATFSVLLEENESEQLISLCLTGYSCAIRISNALNMDTSRLAFVTSLKKFTLLGSSKEMKAKNISAVQMLLAIVNTEGNALKESWAEVLMCISEVERLHLIATSNKPNVDVFVGETQVVQSAARVAHSAHYQSQQYQPSMVVVPAPSQQVSGRGGANREVDSANAGKLLVDVALIERVFINSANLDGDAVVDFVSALRAVSEHELSGVQPRVFSLQKIVEITYYNMGRIRLVWSRIWNILSDFFVKAGQHPNLGVSLYAVDSLRQLAMKFLEKDELSSFSYQKQFFRPFELIMAANASVEARELIVQCCSRMVLARKRNIKSGWRGVFVVLSIAAQQSHAALIQSSADLLSTIMEQHFTLITELDTMEECVNALVSFASQSTYLDVSLQAVHYLTLCATHMGSIPVGELASRSAATTPRHRSGSISSAAGATAGPPTGQSQLSAALAAEGDLSLSAVQHPAGVAATAGTGTTVAAHQSMSAPSTPAHLPAQPPLLPSMSSVSQANLLKVWFLLLTGLSRLVSDSRVEVRTLSLNTLYSILNENGHVFSGSTWRAIFHGVLLPQFDDIRHHIDEHAAATSSNGTPTHARSLSLELDDEEPHSPDTPHPDSLSSWLQTTCHTALSSLVALFCRFYSTTYFLLPDLLTLLAGCVSSELEQLAVSGVESLALLIRDSCGQWSVGSTWIVLEAVMEIVKRTLPTQLLSGKVRRTLGLPPLATAERPLQHSEPHKTPHSQTVEKPMNAEAANGLHSDERKEDDAADANEAPQQPKSSAADSTSSAAEPASATVGATIDTTRQRGSLDPFPAAASLLLSFSAPLIATRCKIQLILLQALFDASQSCFPQRDGSVQSVLPSAQQARTDEHFRRPSVTQLSLPSTAPSMSPIARSTSISARGSLSTDTSRTAAGTPSQSQPLPLPAQSTTTERSVTSSSSSSSSSAAGSSVDASDGRSLSRDDHRVFGHFLPGHLLYGLSIFSLTLSFSHTFNSDIALRKRLYQAGFIMEQAGRLPQLFELEAAVTRFAWTSMFRLWKEGGARGSSTQQQQHELVDLGMEAMQDIASGKEADVLSSPLAASILGSGPQLSYAAAYQSSVELCYHRLSLLTSRLLTDYLTKTQAGQLVALEHVDDVVVSMVDSYASLRLSLFVCDMDVIVPLFGELAEWGSLNVRGAVRRWIQGKALKMMHVAVSRAQHEHDIDQLFDSDADDDRQPYVHQQQPQRESAGEVEQSDRNEQQQQQQQARDSASAVSDADTNGGSVAHSTPTDGVQHTAETVEVQQASG